MPRKNEPFLGLGYGWNTGENGWGSGYNEAIKTLSVLCNGGVETIQNDPVASPVAGKAYVVGTVPTGLWVGKANHIAYWDADSTSWTFIQPRVGLNVLVKAQGNSGEWYYYGTGNTWVRSATSTYSGVVLDGGECDLSGGVYPQPIMDGGVKCSTVWYIKVGGSVDGIPYDSGDQLRYTTANNGFYFRIDARDDVVSVNGEKGAVVLTPEKIGADPAGTAASAVSAHEIKVGAHAISGVNGLQSALDSKYSQENKPTAADVGADPAGTAKSAVLSHEEKLDPHPQYLTSAEIGSLEDRVAVLEQRKSTCLVNAAGTGAPHETVVAELPAVVNKGTPYVLPNPFGNNTPVICWAEIYANNEWANTGWAFVSQSGQAYGTRASYVQGKGIVVQTGAAAVVATYSVESGGGHGGYTGALASAPCRVFIEKIGL